MDKGNGGFSIVSILLVMGAVLGAITLVSQSRLQNKYVQKVLKSKQSYSDVSQALGFGLFNKIDGHLMTQLNCMNATTLIDVPLQGNAKFSFTSNVAVSPDAPESHKAAKQRCSNVVQPTAATDNRYYFCLNFTKDPLAPKDSIFNAEFAFAEIDARLINLGTRQPLSCKNYGELRKAMLVSGEKADSSTGMEVTIGLYWSLKNNQKLIHSQKLQVYLYNPN